MTSDNPYASPVAECEPQKWHRMRDTRTAVFALAALSIGSDMASIAISYNRIDGWERTAISLLGVGFIFAVASIVTLVDYVFQVAKSLE